LSDVKEVDESVDESPSRKPCAGKEGGKATEVVV